MVATDEHEIWCTQHQCSILLCEHWVYIIDILEGKLVIKPKVLSVTFHFEHHLDRLERGTNAPPRL